MTIAVTAVVGRQRSTKIVLDTSLLIAFLTEFFTREGPDYAIHSWVGIVLIPIIAIHLSGNVGWITRVWKRKRDDREFALGVLNATLGALSSICIATGSRSGSTGPMPPVGRRSTP